MSPRSCWFSRLTTTRSTPSSALSWPLSLLCLLCRPPPKISGRPFGPETAASHRLSGAVGTFWRPQSEPPDRAAAGLRRTHYNRCAMRYRVEFGHTI